MKLFIGGDYNAASRRERLKKTAMEGFNWNRKSIRKRPCLFYDDFGVCFGWLGLFVFISVPPYKEKSNTTLFKTGDCHIKWEVRSGMVPIQPLLKWVG